MKTPEHGPHECPNCNWQCTCSDQPCSCCNDDNEDNFNHCSDCDLPDACSDFGCAIEQGLKRKPGF